MPCESMTSMETKYSPTSEYWCRTVFSVSHPVSHTSSPSQSQRTWSRSDGVSASYEPDALNSNIVPMSPSIGVTAKEATGGVPTSIENSIIGMPYGRMPKRVHSEARKSCDVWFADNDSTSIGPTHC